MDSNIPIVDYLKDLLLDLNTIVEDLKQIYFNLLDYFVRSSLPIKCLLAVLSIPIGVTIMAYLPMVSLANSIYSCLFKNNGEQPETQYRIHRG